MKDKVVVITGAFGALGQVVAQTLAAAGAKLALVDAASAVPAGLEQAVAGHRTWTGVDLTDAHAAQSTGREVAAAFGRIDALVNVAGGFRWETVDGGDPATWDLMFAMNLKTALNACQAVLPALKAAGQGRIVNIGAGAAAKAALGMGAYAASKAGVQRLTEALAEEGKDQGYTVNAVLPSIIDTPTNRKDMPDADHARWVPPQAVADLVHFLLSPQAQSINGAGIPIVGRV